MAGRTTDTNVTHNPILLSELPLDSINVPASMAQVKKTYGTSYFRQLAEMLLLRLGRGRIHPVEYLRLKIYRPELTWAQKRQFVGRAGGYRLSSRLSPPEIASGGTLLTDKVMSSHLMASFGLPVPATLGLFPGFAGLDSVNSLEDEAAVTAFLGDPNLPPTHGKPVHGSRALGQISISGPGDTPGTVRLVGGRQVSAAEMAKEIATQYPDGYLFQPTLLPHPDLGPMALPGATVRIMTLQTSFGIGILYANMKAPAKDAHGRLHLKTPIRCWVDIETGILSPTSTSPDAVPTSVSVPDWEKMQDLAIGMHMALDGYGILGWDVMPTPDGPVFLEVNTHPHFTQFEKDFHGLLNPTIKPLIDDALALAETRVDAAKAKAKAENKLQIRYRV